MPQFRTKPVVIEAEQWFPGKDVDGVIFMKSSNSPNPRSHYIDASGGGYEVSPGDWIIRGIKGERYPCNPDTLAAMCDQVVDTITPPGGPLRDMDFGEALHMLRKGKKVARAGWNGKGMWIDLIPPDYYGCFSKTCFAVKTADDEFVPWVADQTDLLAEDWEVVG